MELALAILALGVAAYGAWLSTRNFRWQRRLDERRRTSDIEITLEEQRGLGDGPLVVGETLPTLHLLTVGVINRGEEPVYVHEIRLQSQKASPMTVVVRRGEGTTEVRPKDQEAFVLELDGHQAFEWDQSFRAIVSLADKQIFASDYGALGAVPCHGMPITIRDPDAVPADEVQCVRLGDLVDDIEQP